jgi:hypothetical protein
MENDLDLSLDSLSAPTPAQPPVNQSEPRTYTDVELEMAVNDGTVSQAVADRIKEDQRQATLAAGVVDTLDARTAAREQADMISVELEAYTAKVPGIRVEGSPERLKLQKEHDALVAIGADPKNPSTEVAALKAAFGPVGVPAALPVIEPHQEGGSGQGSGEGPGEGAPPADPSIPPADLTPRQQTHYTHLISIGVIKDWGEVRAELLHQDLSVSRRAQVMNG